VVLSCLSCWRVCRRLVARGGVSSRWMWPLAVVPGMMPGLMLGVMREHRRRLQRDGRGGGKGRHA
jgi:hypothetical protein